MTRSRRLTGECQRSWSYTPKNHADGPPARSGHADPRKPHHSTGLSPPTSPVPDPKRGAGGGHGNIRTAGLEALQVIVDHIPEGLRLAVLTLPGAANARERRWSYVVRTGTSRAAPSPFREP